MELARFIHRLLGIFKEDKEIRDEEPYQVMQRLFDENCEAKEVTKKGPKGTNNSK